MTEIAHIDSPIGPLRLTAQDGALTGLYMNAEGPANRPTTGVLADAADQLDAYFAGTLTTFELPLATHGSPFQELVWAHLKTILYGETTTYGEIALALGKRPVAARAVGLANGSNPISIIVPCHRVIGAKGALTGYGGGLERKEFLLAHEGATLV